MTTHLVSVPVADLRGEPAWPRQGSYEHDPLQETQTLYGEAVEVVEERGEWVRVLACEQITAGQNVEAKPYPGWMARDNVRKATFLPRPDLVVRALRAPVFSTSQGGIPSFVISIGTRLEWVGSERGFAAVRLVDGKVGWVSLDDVQSEGEAASHPDLRRRLVQTSQLFCGMMYLWGGRSGLLESLSRVTTGVDCSGLVSLVYRSHGLILPRNAQDQWNDAIPIALDSACPGDLFFISKPDEPTKIRHVMMALGGEDFVEAPHSGERVRNCSFQGKLGQDLVGIRKLNYCVNGETISAGRPRVLVERD